MRGRQESAITRRDDSLARIRKLSARIAGGATAASFALAAALGFALPGHSYRASTPVSHPGQNKRGDNKHGGTTAGHQGSGGTVARHQGSGKGSGGLTPPTQPPSSSVAPPITTSGGS